MIDRRSGGTTNVHFTLLCLEAVGLWLALSVSGLSFTTLLPKAAYPVAIIIGIIGARRYFRAYTNNLTRFTLLDSLRLAVRQVLCVSIVIFSVAVIFKDPGLSRVFLAVFLLCLLSLLVFANCFQTRWLANRFFKQNSRIPALLIGDSARFPDFAGWLAQQQLMGLQPIGLVAYRSRVAHLPHIPACGDFARIRALIAESGARKVVMLDHPDSPEDAELLVDACVAEGCRLLIHNNFGYRLRYPLSTFSLDAYSFMTLHDEPLEDPWNRCLKRTLDLIISLFAVLFILPGLSAVVWLMQRLQSPGPLFFSQTRTGHNFAAFRILKFRTMHHGALDDEARQASARDTRIYPFARFLRRTSLDEFPQFLNVLRGDMSVVGPRPHLVAHDDQFSRVNATYRMRFLAKPGITGLAQMRGFRGLTDTDEKLHSRVHLDLEYIRNWSIWVDCWIIVRTARQLVAPSKNAH
jgi:exopolysaccharide biosynthesis polyprenyl glycosylphosphotransferase